METTIEVTAKSEMIDFKRTFTDERKCLKWLAEVKELHVSQNTVRGGTFNGHIQDNPSKLKVSIKHII